MSTYILTIITSFILSWCSFFFPSSPLLSLSLLPLIPSPLSSPPNIYQDIHPSQIIRLCIFPYAYGRADSLPSRSKHNRRPIASFLPQTQKHPTHHAVRDAISLLARYPATGTNCISPPDAFPFLPFLPFPPCLHYANYFCLRSLLAMGLPPQRLCVNGPIRGRAGGGSL
jgi:hypothetical protein